MKKLHVHCLAFNTLKMVRASIERFESQRGIYPIENKILIDQHYPIVADRQKHQHGLIELCEEFGWSYARPAENLGVAGGWNFAVQELGLGDNDFLWGNDPDCFPLKAGYLDAAMNVANANEQCVTVQLNDPGVHMLNLPRDEYVCGGENVIRYRNVTAWPVGGFSVAWLHHMGGFLQGHPVYGYCEIVMYNRFHPQGGQALMLRDYHDSHQRAEDALYVQWKVECAQQRTRLPLDAWMRERGISAPGSDRGSV